MVRIMNEHIDPSQVLDADAANGGTRRKFTVDEFERLARQGILDHDERLELIEGDLCVMSPKGRRHEVLRSELYLTWARRLSNLKIASETPLRLSDDTEPVPDLIVYPSNLVAPDVRADTVLLVVEIADTSLAYDLSRKAAVYAASGVPEYWVINAKTLVTRVHRRPVAGEVADAVYEIVMDMSADQAIAPTASPELQVRLADLEGL